jgi:hypothetical protein
MTQLTSVSPAGVLFRLSHGPDPWEWPPWAFARPDGTFGNRWDDPQGLYRVMYACSQRLGTFVETLARFRPDPAVVEGLDAIAEDSPSAAVLRPGEVPRSWLNNRRVAQARVAGQFVTVGSSDSIAWLRDAMADRLVHYGMRDLDGASIRLSAPRRFTQEVSRTIFAISHDGRRRYDGIDYLSRLGDDFQNWAIFEPGQIEPVLPQNLAETDQDFRAALELLGLKLVDG